jgi:hypothetical protein
MHLEVLCLCRKTWIQRTDSQQVQRSIYGVLFVFMSLMKSLPMVARTKVLRRNTPGDWSVKDRNSCTKNLHLGREDDIVKIMQVEGAKCINAWGPTGAKRRPNRAEVGLGRSAPAGGPGLLPTSVRPPFLAPKGFSTLKPMGCNRTVTTRRYLWLDLWWTRRIEWIQGSIEAYTPFTAW